MGFRTVVILNNDVAHEWATDPELGKRIDAAAGRSQTETHTGYFKYGNVVEVAHADVQTLGIIDSHQFTPLTHANWYHGQQATERDLRLLKDAADKLGYRLVRKSK